MRSLFRRSSALSLFFLLFSAAVFTAPAAASDESSAPESSYAELTFDTFQNQILSDEPQLYLYASYNVPVLSNGEYSEKLHKRMDELKQKVLDFWNDPNTYAPYDLSRDPAGFCVVDSEVLFYDGRFISVAVSSFQHDKYHNPATTTEFINIDLSDGSLLRLSDISGSTKEEFEDLCVEYLNSPYDKQEWKYDKEKKTRMGMNSYPYFLGRDGLHVQLAQYTMNQSFYDYADCCIPYDKLALRLPLRFANAETAHSGFYRFRFSESEVTADILLAKKTGGSTGTSAGPANKSSYSLKEETDTDSPLPESDAELPNIISSSSDKLDLFYYPVSADEYNYVTVNTGYATYDDTWHYHTDYLYDLENKSLTIDGDEINPFIALVPFSVYQDLGIGGFYRPLPGLGSFSETMPLCPLVTEGLIQHVQINKLNGRSTMLVTETIGSKPTKVLFSYEIDGREDDAKELALDWLPDGRLGSLTFMFTSEEMDAPARSYVNFHYDESTKDLSFYSSVIEYDNYNRKCEITYDQSKRPAVLKDILNNNAYLYDYSYNSDGNLESLSCSYSPYGNHIYELSLSYDEYGRVTGYEYSDSDSSRKKCTFSYPEMTNDGTAAADQGSSEPLEVEFYEYREEEINEDTGDILAFIDYYLPTVSGGDASAAGINSEMNDLIESMQSSYNELRKVARQQADNGMSVYTKYEYARSEIIYDDDRLLTIAVNYCFYGGGAHGYYQTYFYTLDKEQGKLLTLPQVIGIPETEFERLLIDEFLKDAMFKNNIWKATEIVTNRTMSDYSFYPGKSGMHIKFRVYDIGGYSDGSPDYVIPYDKLDLRVPISPEGIPEGIDEPYPFHGIGD